MDIERELNNQELTNNSTNGPLEDENLIIEFQNDWNGESGVELITEEQALGLEI